MPPVDANIEYKKNNGVFRHIFEKQDRLFGVVQRSQSVRTTWLGTQDRFLWQPKNEALYHNQLLEFLRDNYINIEGIWPRGRPQDDRGDGQGRNDQHRRLATPRSVARQPVEGRRQVRPSASSMQSVVRVPTPSLAEQVELMPARSLKRKADEAEPAESTTTKRHEATVTGDPKAMQKGYEAFTKQCQQLKVANNGSLPKHWDSRGALEQCYIDAHLALGKDPPWQFIESAVTKDTGMSSINETVRIC